jgi:cytochrome c oxidase assembly protein subunit 15
VVLGITTLRMELAVPALTIAHQLVAALLIALMGAVLGRSLAPLPNRRFLEIAHG